MNFDFTFMIEQIPKFMDAALMTLEVGVIVILTSFLVGLCGATSLFFRVKGLRKWIRGYVEVARNTPLLVQLFLLYFGLPSIGIKLSSFTSAVIAMTFLGGGYMIESLRSGIEAVNHGQLEAGLALGMSKQQVFRCILLPQALRIALPALIGNFIFLLKETSIVSAISVKEILYTATDIIATFYKTFEVFTLVGVFYLLLILPLSGLSSWVERRMKYE